MNLLNELEFTYDKLILVSKNAETPWKHCCLRQADKVLVLVDTAKEHKPEPIERLFSTNTLYKDIKPHLLLQHG